MKKMFRAGLRNFDQTKSILLKHRLEFGHSGKRYKAHIFELRFRI